MRFDFLSDTANDILDMCENIDNNKQNYVNTLNRKLTKKENRCLDYWFTLIEYLKYQKQNNQTDLPLTFENIKPIYLDYLKENKVVVDKKVENLIDELKQKDGYIYPDVNKDYEYNTLEFDEIQDLLDEDNNDENTDSDDNSNLNYDEFESF